MESKKHSLRARIFISMLIAIAFYMGYRTGLDTEVHNSDTATRTNAQNEARLLSPDKNDRQTHQEQAVNLPMSHRPELRDRVSTTEFGNNPDAIGTELTNQSLQTSPIPDEDLILGTSIEPGEDQVETDQITLLQKFIETEPIDSGLTQELGEIYEQEIPELYYGTFYEDVTCNHMFCELVVAHDSDTSQYIFMDQAHLLPHWNSRSILQPVNGTDGFYTIVAIPSGDSDLPGGNHTF